MFADTMLNLRFGRHRLEIGGAEAGLQSPNNPLEDAIERVIHRRAFIVYHKQNLCLNSRLKYNILTG